MARYRDTHTRIVGGLKLVLPLAALVILSTLFLVSRRTDPEAAIPYSDVDVEAILRDQRVAAPEYAGVTGDGAAIRLAADSARPDVGRGIGDGAVEALALRGGIDLPGGGHVGLTAGGGRIDTAARVARLTGGVRVRTSTGYDIHADAVETLLDATALTAAGPVRAEGPPGTLTAGAMELSRPARANAGDGTPDAATPEAGTGLPPALLVFKDGVRLVYTPPSNGG